MDNLRRRLRAWTWIALVAMLGLALAPTVSRGMASAAPWQQICSAATAGHPPADPSDVKLGHVDHCPLCAASAAPMGMPPVVDSPSLRADLAHFRPALFSQSSRPLFAWTSPPSRGPPAHS